MACRSSFDLVYDSETTVSLGSGFLSFLSCGKISRRITPRKTQIFFIQALSSAGSLPSNGMSPLMTLAMLVEFSAAIIPPSLVFCVAGLFPAIVRSHLAIFVFCFHVYVDVSSAAGS